MVPGHVAQVRRGCGHAAVLQSRPSEPLPCGKLSLGERSGWFPGRAKPGREQHDSVKSTSIGTRAYQNPNTANTDSGFWAKRTRVSDPSWHLIALDCSGVDQTVDRLGLFSQGR